jgi:hypothetical protein
MVFWVSPPLNANVLFCKFVLNLTRYMTKLRVLVPCFPLLYRQLYYMEKWDGHGSPVLDVDCVKESGELRWSQSEWGGCKFVKKEITYVDTRSWILISGITSFKICTFIFSQIWLNLSMEDHFGYITKLKPNTPPPPPVLQLGNQPFFMAGNI